MRFVFPEWQRRVELTHRRTEQTLMDLAWQLSALESTMAELRVLLPEMEMEHREQLSRE